MVNRVAFTLNEVAELVGVSLRTVRREVDRGNLNVARVGERRVRVSAPELARWWKEKGGGELWLDVGAWHTIAVASGALETVRKIGTSSIERELSKLDLTPTEQKVLRATVDPEARARFLEFKKSEGQEEDES